MFLIAVCFCARFCAHFCRLCFHRQLKCGDPRTSEFGSVSSLEHRTKIESFVALAIKDGGQILCGGKRPADLPAPFDQGAFFEPTLIGGLDCTHACSVQEIFGPVATVHRFTTEEEVIAAANNTKYGLAGSLWTNNLQRAHRIARQWETGMCWINCWLHRDLRVPFGVSQPLRTFFPGLTAHPRVPGCDALPFYLIAPCFSAVPVLCPC